MNDKPLTEEERAACAVCADLLAGSRLLTAPSAIVVAFGLFTASAHAMQNAALALLAFVAMLLLAWASERYLARRVDLDARLFDRLACGELTLDALDAGLQQVLRVDPEKAGRAVALRIAGAQRLHRWHLAAFGVLTAAAVLSSFIHF
jgi:hypothetical protein